MPILPRYESIQGPIPTATATVPGIEAFPGYANSKMAAQIGAVGEAVTDAAIKRKRVKDYLLDESLKTELALNLDAAAQEVESAPPKTKKGIDLTSSIASAPLPQPSVDGNSAQLPVPNFLSDNSTPLPTPGEDVGLGRVPFVTTSVIPKSETMEADYLERQKQIVADIKKRGGTPNLDIAIERMTRTGTLKVRQRAEAIGEEENVALVLERNHALSRRLGSIPVPPSATDENGVTVFNPDADRSYMLARSGIARGWDEAVAVGGVKSPTAEKNKNSALAKLDKNRASQTMHASPERWLAASGANTNGWAARLTAEEMQRLDDKAEAILRRQEGGANQRRLEIERETEADFFVRSKPDAAQPLTLPDITRAVRERRIGREKGEHWETVVKNLKVGGWDDVPEVRIPMALEAGSFRVQPSFLDRVDAKVRNRELSLKTGEEMKDKARGIIQKRQDVALQEDFKTFSATQSAMTTMLTTSPLLGAKLDQESQTVRANAQEALLQNAQRNGWGTSFEWWKKNQERFTSQLQDRVSSQIEVFNGQLPVPIQKDPKTRQILPEGIQAATQAAFERHKIDPAKAAELQKTGRLPAGLLNELKTLDELEKWTQFQADYRAKRETQKGN